MEVIRNALLIAVGLILCVFAVLSGIRVTRFIRESESADGVVIKLNAGSSHPQIRFTTIAGQEIEYPQGGFIYGYHTGDRVRVRYKREAPFQTARLDTFAALWGTSMFLAVLATVCILAGFSALKR
jgi:hypothetical protein